jgi:hypothetical protein
VLRLIQGGIRSANEFIEVHIPIGASKAHAHRRPNGLAFPCQRSAFDVGSNSLGRFAYRTPVGPQQQDDELIAAITREKIRLSYACFCAFRYRFKQGVSSQMSETIVDRFEPVDVEYEQTRRFPRREPPSSSGPNLEKPSAIHDTR